MLLLCPPLPAPHLPQQDLAPLFPRPEWLDSCHSLSLVPSTQLSVLLASLLCPRPRHSITANYKFLLYNPKDPMSLKTISFPLGAYSQPPKCWVSWRGGPCGQSLLVVAGEVVHFDPRQSRGNSLVPPI